MNLKKPNLDSSVIYKPSRGSNFPSEMPLSRTESGDVFSDVSTGIEAIRLFIHAIFQRSSIQIIKNSSFIATDPDSRMKYENLINSLNLDCESSPYFNDLLQALSNEGKYKVAVLNPSKLFEIDQLSKLRNSVVLSHLDIIHLLQEFLLEEGSSEEYGSEHIRKYGMLAQGCFAKKDLEKLFDHPIFVIARRDTSSNILAGYICTSRLTSSIEAQPYPSELVALGDSCFNILNTMQFHPDIEKQERAMMQKVLEALNVGDLAYSVSVFVKQMDGEEKLRGKGLGKLEKALTYAFYHEILGKKYMLLWIANLTGLSMFDSSGCYNPMYQFPNNVENKPSLELNKEAVPLGYRDTHVRVADMVTASHFDRAEIVDAIVETLKELKMRVSFERFPIILKKGEDRNAVLRSAAENLSLNLRTEYFVVDLSTCLPSMLRRLNKANILKLFNSSDILDT
ncbi:hypothetical protein HYV57_04710 [Candidatus Peregrinibacteria bacterium]|nr:hypothetical protein [Candidatus Peregrinibacteria bacterium]